MRTGVTIDSRRLIRSIKALEKHLENARPFYRKASIEIRDYVRDTIRMQGRREKYDALHPWNVKRTGRRKALTPLIKNIKASATKSNGTVYFQRVSPGWHINGHHNGYTSGAVFGKKMIIAGRGSKPIAAFSNKKRSKVPAREVWPSQREANSIVAPIADRWVKDGTKKWR